jgi:6-pyruvoyltetrahydropterin/6-carboxytetrahydropterin synthase
VRNALKTILAELDHRVLLPTQHAAIRASSQTGEVEAMFADRRWVFPKDNCLLLAVANTTTEMLAQHVGERLAAALKLACRLRIEISEGTGCAAICDLQCQ